VEEMDAGPVYMKRDLDLDGRAEEIFSRAAVLIGDMIRLIVKTHPQPVPQMGEAVTFKRRRPEDGDLAPLTDLERLYDYIRMLDAEGYPRAYLQTEYFRLEFSHAQLQTDQVEATVRITKRTK
jgi:methionyl-tRNA formyltransferase